MVFIYITWFSAGLDYTYIDISNQKGSFGESLCSAQFRLYSIHLIYPTWERVQENPGSLLGLDYTLIYPTWEEFRRIPVLSSV